MPKNSVIILSGGMDSVTLLHLRREEIALALSFDYGSKHNEMEIKYAKEHCKQLAIPHLVIPLGFINDYFESSLLKNGGEIPTGDYDSDNIHSTVVPFRNGIMLSVACGIAESRKLDYVMMANHSGDHEIYPDCRPEFVDAMSEAMKAGTYNGVTLLTEFTHLNKTEIALIGKRLNIDYSQTYSCYNGGKKHCGICATCRERKRALKEAGLTDLTEYEN